VAGRSRAKLNMLAGEIDMTWMKFGRCRICHRRICVNNYPDHEIRPPRKLGIVCCPWCSWEAAFSYVMAREMGLCDPDVPEDLARLQKLQKRMRRFLDADPQERKKIAQRGAGKAARRLAHG